MTTLLIALLAFGGYIVAYHTYGRWLARRVFALDRNAPVPSKQLRDDLDYVPTKKEVIFGHHFTSIAGTGPIVGPAIAVFWGWLPALLWVVFGSILVGAVHDFSALVVSLRNQGHSLGEIAGRMIAPRARILFLLILFFALTIVLAVFGLVIAIVFAGYPESILSVWIEIPLAVGIGFWVYRKGGGLLVPSLLALGVMYIAIWIGAYYLPIDLAAIFKIPLIGEQFANAVVIWTLILLVYCFVASVLPVWTLLQPRDFINSHQLMLALGLLVVGLAVASLTGAANLFTAAPPIAKDIPADAPPIMPFLFITVACGAVSGFHCLVSSGTTSKQISNECHAQYVGYGSMLLESMLATIVILACCAGVGMGVVARKKTSTFSYQYNAVADASGNQIVGQKAWRHHYQTDVAAGGGWANHKLPKKVGAFIEGGGNFLTSVGLPLKIAIGIVAVLVASFAATTIDTATRLQRYVIQELGSTIRLKPLTNRYVATAVALVLAGAVALLVGENPGGGGMQLWPLFGAINQLLAGLAFLVAAFYLWRRNKPIWFVIPPVLFLMVMPAWAMLWQMFNPDSGWLQTQRYGLLSVGVIVLALQAWMIVEGLLVWRKAKGVLEEPLPPPQSKPALEGGRSC